MDFADDPVREEHDIYLSKELANQLYLLQFPLRPKGRTYPNPNSARFKPENDILELAYQLPQDEHYDVNAPERQHIREITMKSSRNPAKATYAIGVTHNGCIYLTPIKSTLVMRPDISYLDRVPEEIEEELVGMNEESTKPAPKTKTLTEVRVEYSKRRNDENHFGPLTYTELSGVQNEEPWVKKEVYPPEHSSSHAKIECLEMSSEVPLPSSASVEMFTQGMRDQANREIMDTAADPDWKVLSSPDYPGRVDSKEWIAKRKLRHPQGNYLVFMNKHTKD